MRRTEDKREVFAKRKIFELDKPLNQETSPGRQKYHDLVTENLKSASQLVECLESQETASLQDKEKDYWNNKNSLKDTEILKIQA